MSSTPKMGLDKPDVGGDAGTWGNALNENSNLIDDHDHTSGKGSQVPSAGLDLSDGDLSFQGNAATNLESTQYTEQTANLSDVRAIFVRNGDLYFVNGSGVVVQITDGSGVDATPGSIGGLPSGNASVDFATGTFTFNQDTNQRAQLDVGPVLVRDTAANGKGWRLLSPAGMVADLDVTLPSAYPASTAFLKMTAAGIIQTLLQIQTTDIADEAVTLSKLAPLNEDTADITNGTDNSGSWISLPGGAVTIVGTGRPVIVGLRSQGTLFGSIGHSVSGSIIDTGFRWSVTGVDTTETGGCTIEAVVGEQNQPNCFTTYYAPSGAGSITFTPQLLCNASNTVSWSDLQSFVYEL